MAPTEQPRDVILVVELSPDPDALNALVIAATLHVQGELRLRAVVCTGGGLPEKRARLALCTLNQLGIEDIPVGFGAPGASREESPHEFVMDGFASTADDMGRIRPEGLLLATLRARSDGSVSVACCGAATDIAIAIREDPDLFASKVRRLPVAAPSPHPPRAPAPPAHGHLPAAAGRWPSSPSVVA